jgi:hypothetical protein
METEASHLWDESGGNSTATCEPTRGTMPSSENVFGMMIGKWAAGAEAPAAGSHWLWTHAVRPHRLILGRRFRDVDERAFAVGCERPARTA